MNCKYGTLYKLQAARILSLYLFDDFHSLNLGHLFRKNNLKLF